jgi:hypothetical protein
VADLNFDILKSQVNTSIEGKDFVKSLELNSVLFTGDIQ